MYLALYNAKRLSSFGLQQSDTWSTLSLCQCPNQSHSEHGSVSLSETSHVSHPVYSCFSVWAWSLTSLCIWVSTLTGPSVRAWDCLSLSTWAWIGLCFLTWAYFFRKYSYLLLSLGLSISPCLILYKPILLSESAPVSPPNQSCFLTSTCFYFSNFRACLCGVSVCLQLCPGVSLPSPVLQHPVILSLVIFCTGSPLGFEVLC